MKIFVIAKPRAYQKLVKKIDDTHFSISVVEPPANGLANKAIIRLLADYFDVPPSLVHQISGFTSKHKIFEIMR
jgi:uncharacterized protein YggU (UPF0235/DUF167 family)